MADPILTVESLNVTYASSDERVVAVRDISLTLRRGETLGITGESGSGKSTLAHAIVQSVDDNGEVMDGSIAYEEQTLGELPDRDLSAILGQGIAFVPQNAEAALNPTLTVGEQISETVMEHCDVSGHEACRRAARLLSDVNIPDPDGYLTRYPHELSGGEKQRVLLAISLSCDPDVLLLDEPTTGLDVTTQAKITSLIDNLVRRSTTSVMLITHNLPVIRQLADRTAVMSAGEIVERGPTEDVFDTPTHPYTQTLLAAATDNPVRSDESGGVSQSTETGKEILAADGVSKRFDEPSAVMRTLDRHLPDVVVDSRQPIKAVRDVNLCISESESVGIVGESGCGKSTLAKTLLRLYEPSSGTVSFRGRPVERMSASELQEFYADCRIVLQDQSGSLNPSKRIFDIIAKPLRLFTDLDEGERARRVKTLLNEVNLDLTISSSFSHEISGGEKQRVAIARALASDPKLVVFDEPVVALDASTQAEIVRLLSRLRSDYDLSYLLISHDLSLVSTLCDRLYVMYLGQVVESGTRTEVLDSPHHPYTRALLSSIPDLNSVNPSPPGELGGDVPTARMPPAGCSFHTRCPQKIGSECVKSDPCLREVEGGDTHRIACHLDEAELSNDTTTSKPGEMSR